MSAGAVRAAVIRRSALAAIPCTLVIASCCTTPPKAGKFFSRDNCKESLRGFVYAVDVGEWDYAFESLTLGSREEIGSPLRFQIAVNYLKDPIFKDISLYKLISESVPNHGEEQRLGDRGSIIVTPFVKDEDGRITFFKVPLLFLREDEEWRLDLLGSLEAVRSTMPSESGDLTRRG